MNSVLFVVETLYVVCYILLFILKYIYGSITIL